MSVLIGNASIDENGNITNGIPGDQTGKEVWVRDWYDDNWTDVLRPKTKDLANKIASLMEEACSNNNIGYSQNDRLSLYREAKKLNYKISAISTPCNCDCSSLVAVCVNGAGIDVNPDMYTGNESLALLRTNYFDIYRSPEYLVRSSYLKRGDILVSRYRHTAIVLSDGAKVSPDGIEKITIEDARNFSKDVAGIYRATTNVYVRCGAGKAYKAINVLKEGEVCRCYGYYTLEGDKKWLYVQRLKMVGFVSSKYLKKE